MTLKRKDSIKIDEHEKLAIAVQLRAEAITHFSVISLSLSIYGFLQCHSLLYSALDHYPFVCQNQTFFMFRTNQNIKVDDVAQDPVKKLIPSP